MKNADLQDPTDDDRNAFISAVASFAISLLGNMLRGYVEGKQNAESVLQSLYPETGTILRPGFIHGTRMIGDMALPLGAVGQPLETVGS